MRMKNITDYLEKEQVDRVLTAAQQCSTRDYLMPRVLWRSGVRVNELLNIKPSDVESRNSVVNVTKAKGGKQRRVHLNHDEIKDVVETVQPKALIPVHNQHPEVFKTLHDNVILPERGSRLTSNFGEQGIS